MTELPAFDAVPSLAQAFERHFSIGVALEASTLQEKGPLVARHFRRLTAENAMKFGEICPSTAGYTFTRADVIANFARAHAMPMTGHTLVWHRMTPSWLFETETGLSSRSSVEVNLRRHIFTMIQRYADVVDNWDVVNEALSDHPDKTWRDASEGSRWYSLFEGESYVARSFIDAAEAAAHFAPHVKLYYNDYNLEVPGKRRKAIEMVRTLRREGVRIDGVGIQGHINLKWPTKEDLVRAVEELAAEDLLVKISELDISVYSKDDPSGHSFECESASTPDLDRALADRYREVFTALRECSSRLTSVTLWGLSDRLSWLNYWPLKRKNYPLLFDAEDRPKAALLAVLGAAG